MTIRSQMSLIMSQIELENPELFVLEFGKIAESDFEFDYGTNRTKTVQVICP